MTEAELTARFAALADGEDDASWADVAERAADLRQSRRRLPLAVAAALVVAVAAAPALGLRGKIVHLFAGAEPAPQRVVRTFSAWNDLAPPDLGPGVRAAGAIKVLERRVGAGSTAVLWLAPARAGLCTLLEVNGSGAGGGCGAVSGAPLEVGVGIHGVSADGKRVAGPVVLDGSTSLRRGDSLVLRFEDGESASIRLVWVTAPVDTGFFVYGVPKEHWRPGHLPTTLTLLAADGKELAERPVTGVVSAG